MGGPEVTAALFVVAAAAGGIGRWQLGLRLGRPHGWPLGTLTVNVVGCFLAGLASQLEGSTRTVVLVGALGSLTTFSTLAVEVVALARADRKRAAAYLALTLFGGLAAVGVGTAL